MKIDIYPHFLPSKYKEALLKKANKSFYSATLDQVFNGTPGLHDLDNRLRMLNRHEGLVQVLTLSSPAVEKIADSQTAVYLCKLKVERSAHPTTFWTFFMQLAAKLAKLNE